MKAYLKDINKNAPKLKELCAEIQQFILDTFEDSKMRFDPSYKPKKSNEYIFQKKKFSIDCNFQFTLNRLLALKLNPDFKDPNVSINLIFGGLFKDRQEAANQEVVESE